MIDEMQALEGDLYRPTFDRTVVAGLLGKRTATVRLWETNRDHDIRPTINAYTRRATYTQQDIERLFAWKGYALPPNWPEPLIAYGDQGEYINSNGVVVIDPLYTPD